ncbi:MAG TPA: hypothetical protein VFW96_25770 [Thermomicrobiales bacterium]|nr:hypothetical protein [Thermomicrobiales bacterium]
MVNFPETTEPFIEVAKKKAKEEPHKVGPIAAREQLENAIRHGNRPPTRTMRSPAYTIAMPRAMPSTPETNDPPTSQRGSIVWVVIMPSTPTLKMASTILARIIPIAATLVWPVAVATESKPPLKRISKKTAAMTSDRIVSASCVARVSPMAAP